MVGQGRDHWRGRILWEAHRAGVLVSLIGIRATWLLPEEARRSFCFTRIYPAMKISNVMFQRWPRRASSRLLCFCFKNY